MTTALLKINPKQLWYLTLHIIFKTLSHWRLEIADFSLCLLRAFQCRHGLGIGSFVTTVPQGELYYLLQIFFRHVRVAAAHFVRYHQAKDRHCRLIKLVAEKAHRALWIQPQYVISNTLKLRTAKDYSVLGA